MIRYALKCKEGHGFDSWFQSAGAFDALKRSGHLTCPECGSAGIEKALMAPQVRPDRKKAAHQPEGDPAPTPAPAPNLTQPDDPRAAALAELRKKVEESSDYVGMNFASEARAMHEGEMPHRPIYGEAKPDEAVKLVEDGVPVAPLPFTPRAKTN